MEKRDVRAGILDVAQRLFSTQGFEGTSTRQIAKESMANMAMINYYFGSKEGVFLEILSRRVEAFNPELKSIREDKLSAMERLLKVVESYARRIMSNMPFHRMMQRELSMAQRPAIFEKIRSVMLDNLDVLEALIEEGIASGEFRNVDTKMLISTILGTTSNVVIYPFRITNGTDLNIDNPDDHKVICDRLVTHLKEIMITYLSPIK